MHPTSPDFGQPPPALKDVPAPSGPRRTLVLGALAAPVAAQWPACAAAAPGPDPAAASTSRKVLRLLFTSAESSFDPVQATDLYSSTVLSHIFESLYGYDHLARPTKVEPRLADGMPEVSADFKVWTVKLRRGIYFADDAAFKGQRRELVADDVLFGFKRAVDPANKSPVATTVLDEGVVGLAELRKAAFDGRKPFDYDAPVAGLQALDRYTVRFTLSASRPRFILNLANPSMLPAQAREVLAFYGKNVGDHPVGTGPFRLKQWVRASKIVLERNPGFREAFYNAEPAADDAEGQALLARFKGRRLPMVDEVEVSIVEENQPQWLSFLNGQVDALVSNTGMVPIDFSLLAVPNGHLAPNLARRGVQLHRTLRADCAMLYFNMEDPVVGGYTPDKVALRRALSLAYDVGREIRLVRRGQAVPAQSIVLPGTTGYDPAFRSTMSEFDPARARALLDMHGYIDRDGDGWRERPDGQPLVLTMTTEPEQIYRQFNDIWRRCLTDVGVRCEFKIAQWPINMKSALGGSLQMWMLGSSAAQPDGQEALSNLYGPQAGEANLARFKLPAFDAIYERMLSLPDGPERAQLFYEAKRLAAAYMPYKVLVHRIANELLHPWVSGYRRTPFWSEWWHLVDLDPALRAAKLGGQA